MCCVVLFCDLRTSIVLIIEYVLCCVSVISKGDAEKEVLVYIADQEVYTTLPDDVQTSDELKNDVDTLANVPDVDVYTQLG